MAGCMAGLSAAVDAAPKASKTVALSQRNSYRFFFHSKLMLTYATPKGGGEIAIQDAAGNTIWVTTQSRFQDFYADLLPQELQRLFGQPVHLYETGDYQESLNLLNQLIKLFPNSPYINHLTGLNYLAISDRERASNYFQQSLKYYPDDPESGSELGILHFQAGEYLTAISYFRNALGSVNQLMGLYDNKNADIPDNFKDGQGFAEFKNLLRDKQQLAEQNLILAYARQADTLYEVGQQQDALRLLESAMKLLPNRPGLMETYRIYAVYPPLPEALERRKDNDLEVWTEEIQRYLSAGKEASALSLIVHLLSIYPNDAKLAEMSGEIVLKRSAALQGSDQIAFLLKSLADQPKQTQIAEALAKALHATLATTTKRWGLEELLEMGEKFAKLAPSDASKGVLGAIYLQYAKRLIADEELTDAKLALEKGASLDPKNRELAEMQSQVLISLAKQYRERGDIVASIDSYKQAIRTGQAGLWIRVVLLSLTLRQFIVDNYQLGILLLIAVVIALMLSKRFFVRLAERQAARRFRREGWQAYQRQHWDIAVDLLSRYIKIAKSTVQFPIYQALAESYRKIHDNESALLIYKKISYLFPQSNCYMDEAKIYVQQRKITLMLAAIKRSSNLQADAKTLIDYCFNLIQKGKDEKELQEIVGSLYLLVNDLERAKYIFTQVVAHYGEQDLRFAYKQLMEISKKEKDVAGLRKILSRYEKHYPDDAGVLLELGYFYESTGEIDKAVGYFQRANVMNYSEVLEQKIKTIQLKKVEQKLREEIQKLGQSPATPTSKLRLAALKFQAGDYSGCINDLNALISEGHGVNEALRLLGLAYYAVEEYVKAAECLEKFLSASQEQASEIGKEARYRLGSAYLKQNLLELAVQEFQRLHSIDPNYRDVREKMHISITSCPYCSRKISSNDVFCPHCNSRVRQSAPEPEAMVGGAVPFVDLNGGDESPLEIADLNSPIEAVATGPTSNDDTDEKN